VIGTNVSLIETIFMKQIALQMQIRVGVENPLEAMIFSKIPIIRQILWLRNQALLTSLSKTREFIQQN
jgi:hypothetical protein